ncbi:MAG TPA: Uma2 family endonuclease [Kribbellaceae bacterium]|nr:Uma2 family endonuclease [Kribbellaceae bacterium]
MGAVMPLPRSRPLTRADLDTMPDDGHRYELIDGVLVVTPAPSNVHQTVSVHLVVLLSSACPPDLKLLHAPFDVALAEDTVMQPDLLVARRVDFTTRDVPVAPLLAVEILSPSTRRFDLVLKRSRLEAAGCASYWVVDPDRPSLVAWELRDRVYVEVANVSGDEVFRATRPFEVAITPADLIL